MQVKYLRDASPTTRTCPTLYATDRGTYLVQGDKIQNPALLSPYNLAGKEDVVEVPAKLLEEIADATAFPPLDETTVTTIPIRAIPAGTSSPSVSATSRNTFVVRGVKVTDPEALAMMDIPDHETVVEVPRDLLHGVRADAA